MKRILTSMFLFLLTMGMLAGCGIASGEKEADNGQPEWNTQYELGIRLINEGKYEEAIVALETAINIDPKQAQNYLALAQIYYNMEEWELALSIMQDGVENCQDVDFLLAQAEAMGIYRNDDGMMEYGGFEEFGEFSEDMSVEEKLQYYFEKDNNWEHWCFEQFIILDGMDTREISMEQLMVIAQKYGWGGSGLSIRKSDYGYFILEDPDAYFSEEGEIFHGFQDQAYVDAGYNCFQNYSLGELSSLIEKTPAAEAAKANKMPLGILDICLGDSLETVLEKLGWEYSVEIGEILRGVKVEDFNAIGSFYMGSYDETADTLEIGEKQLESLCVEFLDGGEEYWSMLQITVAIRTRAEEVSDPATDSQITFTFNVNDYTLECVNVSNPLLN